MFIDEKSKSGLLKAYLVGVKRSEFSRREAEEHLEELRRLSDTMGVEIRGDELVVVDNPTPAFLVGSGKIKEIHQRAKAVEAELIIVDDDLSPAQQRNWEKETELAVIDRREVILDIFAQRAQTREARLQVELARLEYSLPRLKRAWTHLERQRGGGGFVGGAGEAQIEVDRRLVRDSIAKHKIELAAVRRQRATQRKGRQTRPVPTAAVVGYTNSGKSSLLNRMTKAGVLEEDKLFATLDPTTRRIRLPNNQPLLLTDTVGFIRKLPHMLVEAFKATLEEAEVADFLIHVIDASHPVALEQVKATNAVLNELEIGDKPTLYVLNKVDLVSDPLTLAAIRQVAEPAVITSMVSGEGLDKLRAMLADFAERTLVRIFLRIPPDRGDIVAYAYREGRVLSHVYDGPDSLVEVSLPEKARGRLLPWCIDRIPVATTGPPETAT